MHLDFFGLSFETPRVTFYLWSPWRAAALEHRLFEAIKNVSHAESEELPDEWRIHLSDAKAWRSAMQSISRVLKGWQEDAEPGSERRTWRWLVDGDTDADGYDHTSEPFSLWGILRLSLERGGPGETEKNEDIDLEGFGIRVWGNTSESRKN
ncbi:MAG TPA: hypothetical protein VGZ25_03170 [Gemmataceae bacterium]|jgi:hypothetical protein|nr:hypothetical protein [Gemmataceae bacterium]